MTLDELCARRVAVWGMGDEGLAVAQLLIERGVFPVLIDDHCSEASERVGAGLSGSLAVLEPTEVDWRSVDVVVRSPGVSRYRPELAAAAAGGVVVTTAMAIWMEDFHDAAVLAVTGTKGKSTTASLAAAILERQGCSVALVGNIGTPVVGLYGSPAVGVYVVEVSSYQAADVAISPAVSVLTSLAPDHLDWHGSEEVYYRDKLRLITAGPPGELAVNGASPEAVRRTASHPSRSLFGPAGRVRAEASGAVTVDGELMVDAGRLRLPGWHNVLNLCGAIAGVLLVSGKVDPGAVAAAVDDYRGLPSRCRTVGTWGGVEFVDDALASNPFATEASLAAFPGRELTLILGGADRGTDPTRLLRAFGDRQPVPRLVILAAAEDRLSAALRAPGALLPGLIAPVEVADGMSAAVRAAAAATPVGGVVLFSPAAPTPPGQGGYRRRSQEFSSAAGQVGIVPGCAG